MLILFRLLLCKLKTALVTTECVAHLLRSSQTIENGGTVRAVPPSVNKFIESVCLTNVFLKNAVAIWMAQLAQCLSLYLTNSLTGDVENLANFFQGFHATVV